MFSRMYAPTPPAPAATPPTFSSETTARNLWGTPRVVSRRETHHFCHYSCRSSPRSILLSAHFSRHVRRSARP